MRWSNPSQCINCFVIPLPSCINIGYWYFVISIDATLLGCWIMQSWEFDAVSYVEKKREREKIWCQANSNSQMVRARIDWTCSSRPPENPVLNELSSRSPENNLIACRNMNCRGYRYLSRQCVSIRNGRKEIALEDNRGLLLSHITLWAHFLFVAAWVVAQLSLEVTGNLFFDHSCEINTIVFTASKNRTQNEDFMHVQPSLLILFRLERLRNSFSVFFAWIYFVTETVIIFNDVCSKIYLCDIALFSDWDLKSISWSSW
jgi:hypothetical protein